MRSESGYAHGYRLRASRRVGFGRNTFGMPLRLWRLLADLAEVGFQPSATPKVPKIQKGIYMLYTSDFELL